MDQTENHLQLNQAQFEIKRAKFEIKVWGLNLPLIFWFKAATISCQISDSIVAWSIWGSSRIWQTIVDATLLNPENKQLVGKMSKETNPPLSRKHNAMACTLFSLAHSWRRACTTVEVRFIWMKLQTMLIVFFYSSVVMYPSGTTNMCFVWFWWLDSKFSLFSTSPSFFLDCLNIIILESNFCFNYRKLSTTSSMGITYLKFGRLSLFDGSR